MKGRERFLRDPIRHFDMSRVDVDALIEMFSAMSNSARALARASRIYELMLRDKDCTIILCLAGSLFSAGLKKIVVDLLERNMVDAIVSTGANIIDQDFFEALGFRHYVGDPDADDLELHQHGIDRIYDTYISEAELRICDDTIRAVADAMKPGAYSSRQFIAHLGKYLDQHAKTRESVVLSAYLRDVPIFVPAFADCSAGFGLIEHQHARPKRHVTIDAVQDFLELTKLKAAARETGLLMIGGGVPKNFAQDCAVGTAFLGSEERAHKYAVQITVADVRDGGLSGSTLREAASWGKVSLEHEQMVYCEATIAFPILAAYAYKRVSDLERKARRWSRVLEAKPPARETPALPVERT